jgi:hypothetical protein
MKGVFFFTLRSSFFFCLLHLPLILVVRAGDRVFSFFLFRFFLLNFFFVCWCRLPAQDMTTLIHESILQPSNGGSAAATSFVQLPSNPAVSTVAHVERHTRMFPLLQNQTLLHGPQCDDLRMLLDPLKALVLDCGVPPPNALETAIQVSGMAPPALRVLVVGPLLLSRTHTYRHSPHSTGLPCLYSRSLSVCAPVPLTFSSLFACSAQLLGRLEQLSRSNESRLFPHLSHQPAKRFAAYEQLWRDIIQLVECYPKHHSYPKLRSTVYRCALQSTVEMVGEGGGLDPQSSVAASDLLHGGGGGGGGGGGVAAASDAHGNRSGVELSWRSREKVLADRYSSLGQAINTLDSTHQGGSAPSTSSSAPSASSAPMPASASSSANSSASSSADSDAGLLSEQVLIRRQAALISRDLAAQEEAVWPDRVWPRKRKTASGSHGSSITATSLRSNVSVLEYARDSAARRCESRTHERVARARAK